MARETTRLCEVAYYFDEKEQNNLGLELARLDGEIERIEGDKKDANKHYASLLETAQKKRRALAATRRQGYEMRELECRVEWVTMAPERKKIVVRPDTGELIGEEPLTQKEIDAEAQLTLEMQPAAEAPAEGELATAAVNHAETCGTHSGEPCNCYLANTPPAASSNEATEPQPAPAPENDRPPDGAPAEDLPKAAAESNGATEPPLSPPPPAPSKVRRIRT